MVPRNTSTCSITIIISNVEDHAAHCRMAREIIIVVIVLILAVHPRPSLGIINQCVYVVLITMLSYVVRERWFCDSFLFFLIAHIIPSRYTRYFM